MSSLDLFTEDSAEFRKYLPIIKTIENGNPRVTEWDIPYTITQLSYLVHNHYRYYGKFPSVVAGQILDCFPPPSSKHYVLDNFCGSGTTLVEAKLRGVHSFGIDISWLSVLASNVKTKKQRIERIVELKNRLLTDFSSIQIDDFSTDEFIQKWFDLNAAEDLARIRNFLFQCGPSDEKDFLVLAFLGIVRRVSKAFDGEVRPHINKNKKQRNVLDAFCKKVDDMLKRHQAFNSIVDSRAQSECYLADNINLPEKFNDGLCYLTISHPPYLNSFNYAPVYSLEFYWGKLFEPLYTRGSTDHYKAELKAYPANETVTKEYFNHLVSCYKETYRIQPEGGILAVVIGDCTRNGQLIPVIDTLTDRIRELGYEHIETNYRTTHYGLGKYAYKSRADYHGESIMKKDGIICFKK